MKFILDMMLGRLAKYLRFLGYDTFYSNKIVTDEELLEIAKKEDRILITRDKKLAARYDKSYLLTTTETMEQFKEVVKFFKLTDENMLTRCSICNEKLIKIDKEKIKNRVPENVFKNFDDFYFCPVCGRVYWLGSHTKNIKNIIELVKNNEYS